MTLRQGDKVEVLTYDRRRWSKGTVLGFSKAQHGHFDVFIKINKKYIVMDDLAIEEGVRPARRKKVE